VEVVDKARQPAPGQPGFVVEEGEDFIEAFPNPGKARRLRAR